MIDKIFDVMNAAFGVLVIIGILTLIVMLFLFLIYIIISFNQSIWG